MTKAEIKLVKKLLQHEVAMSKAWHSTIAPASGTTRSVKASERLTIAESDFQRTKNELLALIASSSERAGGV